MKEEFNNQEKESNNQDNQDNNNPEEDLTVDEISNINKEQPKEDSETPNNNQEPLTNQKEPPINNQNQDLPDNDTSAESSDKVELESKTTSNPPQPTLPQPQPSPQPTPPQPSPPPQTQKETQPQEHLSSQTAQELEETTEIENLKKIEAALFLSARYLSLQDLIMLTDINPLMLKELITKLTNQYSQDTSSIEIVNKENMWKMDVKEEYVSLINKLATGSAEFTKAEQETLAVIAYKQPVKQSVIIKIRGNKAYEHIKNFIGTGLVQGKRVGHTKELTLSDTFFEYFHLVKKSDGSVEGIEMNEEEINEQEN
jgi:segregation and condensation protein B